MNWSTQRQTVYSFLFLFIFLIIALSVFYLFIYEKPTCFDEKQNQDEQGIDCGGSCVKVCSFSAINPVILWSRSFETTGSVYNAVALVENPNSNFIARDTPYSFKLYDSKNILVYERTGKIDIPTRGILPIFERNIYTGERTPVRTFFEFTEDPVWVRVSLNFPDIFIENKKLVEKDGTTRLSATLMNKTIDPIKNITVSGIIYDEKGNSINASQTFVDTISGGGAEDIVFTWPRVFSIESPRLEVIPSIGF